MYKVCLLTLLGLLVASPLVAQATMEKGEIDQGPFDLTFENPCSPGDLLEGEYYAKGEWTSVSNEQGERYSLNVRYWGDFVGSESGLTFSLSENYHERNIWNYGDLMWIWPSLDHWRLVGRGVNGVEQMIKITAEWEWHFLPDGTEHKKLFTRDVQCKD
jgi:hypothetical protein